MKNFEPGKEFAHRMDEEDPLRELRSEFYFPKSESGQELTYFAGNSLGLQPRKVKEYVNQELDDWARFGVEGHLHARKPWLPYHENLTESTARLVGALPHEVVVMNTLTVNLHLMMVSFYRPTPERSAILIEAGAFPSDRYAVASQIRFHGYDPQTSLIELKPRPSEVTLRPEDILDFIEKNGKSIALILLGNVNYLTGQAFDIERITRAGHAQGCQVGFDLAHGAGNLDLNLHSDGPDFAVWCGYKYLNAGPGSLSGCFVHERHATHRLPRFEGWWGQNKKNRFEMLQDFEPIPGAEGWQLSNPPILQLAALRASMEIFDRATNSARLKKSRLLSAYLEFLLRGIPEDLCTQITPKDPAQRGAQISLKVPRDPKGLLARLADEGMLCDFREPNVVRVAPTALYNRFQDVFHFSEILKGVFQR